MKTIEIDNIIYKKLSEILTIKNGKDYKSHSKGNVPVYGSGGIISYIDTAVYDKPSVLIPRKGSLDKLYFVDTPFWNVDTIFYTEINTELVEPRYLYHYLKQAHLEKLNKAGGVPSLTQAVLNNLTIPLPPLPIQQEIVRILDTFTNFTAELTDKLNAELTARRKQYEYYRDELLTFGEDVPVTTFGEVSTIFRGASPRPIKDYITDDIDGINWIKIGDVRPGTKYITDTAEKITKEGAKKSRFVYKGDFILSNSMSFGRPYIIKKTGCIHDGWLSISEFEEHYSTDFLYHLLSSHKYQSIMKRKASFGGAVQNLNADIVKSLELPIISLNEQRRIVSMLDKFDVICSDICAGLPAEIEARQRQYEYYRGQLLKFDN